MSWVGLARPVRLAAAAALALVAALAAALPAAADPGDPPFDPGEDWTLSSSSEDTATEPAAECGAASEWRWSSGEQELSLLLVPCTDESAADGMWEWLAVPGEVVGNGSQEGELVLWSDAGLVRAWVADGGASTPLAVLTVSCPGEGADACLAGSADLARAAMEDLPGGVVEVSTPGFTPDDLALALVVPVVLIAIVVAPVRIVRSLARSRYRSESASPRYHDVSTAVAIARWRRRVRRFLWWLVAFLVLVGLAGLSIRDSARTLGPLVFTGIIAIPLIIGYRTFLKPHPVERRRRGIWGLGPEAVVGTLLSVLAVALAGLVLIVHTLLVVYGDMSLGWPSLSGEDLERMQLPLLPGLRPVVLSLGDSALLVSTLVAVPALIAVAMLDGLGQRLRSASIDEALAQDNRPHYLYLRSFDEDKLSLTGLLRRRGLLSALSMMRKVRFEEVMVRQLSATGPVIAIAPPGANLPAIGAARASFSNDQWQQHVTRYAQTARAVVLSATPGQIREGYGWELDLVANRIGHQRVLVVLGPWPLSSLRRRWTQFCHAVSHVPLFAPITMPWVPDGVHVLAHSSRLGWQGYGAKRRLDWTYAVAIDEATRAYLPDWS